MDFPKIHESEYRFCLIMWEHEPVTAVELVKLCQDQLCALKRERANQSDSHDTPKQNIDPLGSFLQNKPEYQHSQDKPACRYTHVDNFQKEFVHCEPPFLMRSIMRCTSSSSSSDIA